jgi:hypothetical protein
MIHIRSAREIDKILKAGQIVKDTLEMVEEWVQPGITTLELDNKAEAFIRSKGAEPILLPFPEYLSRFGRPLKFYQFLWHFVYVSSQSIKAGKNYLLLSRPLSLPDFKKPS